MVQNVMLSVSLIFFLFSHQDMLCLQRIREFRAPPESLEKTLENNRPKRRYGQTTMGQEEGAVGGVEDGSATYHMGREDLAEGVSSPSTGNNTFVLWWLGGWGGGVRG